VNSISIDGDEVKLTNDMQYLCKVMGVKLPFLPVHGVKEFKLYVIRWLFNAMGAIAANIVKDFMKMGPLSNHSIYAF
jgi:hypothetical protein